MVVGFVNSGIMKLSQAVGVIMGANIGTTVTSWLLSLTGIQGDNFILSCEAVLFFTDSGRNGIGFLMFSRREEKGYRYHYDWFYRADVWYGNHE